MPGAPLWSPWKDWTYSTPLPAPRPLQLTHTHTHTFTSVGRSEASDSSTEQAAFLRYLAPALGRDRWCLNRCVCLYDNKVQGRMSGLFTVISLILQSTRLNVLSKIQLILSTVIYNFTPRCHERSACDVQGEAWCYCENKRALKRLEVLLASVALSLSVICFCMLFISCLVTLAHTTAISDQQSTATLPFSLIVQYMHISFQYFWKLEKYASIHISIEPNPIKLQSFRLNFLSHSCHSFLRRLYLD